VTDGFDPAESSTPAEAGLAQAWVLRLMELVLWRAREPRGPRRRGWEAGPLHQVRRLRCCKNLVLGRRLSLLQEAAS
jgi:hypothetical protein